MESCFADYEPVTNSLGLPLPREIGIRFRIFAAINVRISHGVNRQSISTGYNREFDLEKQF